MKEWCYYFILAKKLGRETYPDMSNTLGTSVCGVCVCTQICVYILPYAMQNQGHYFCLGNLGHGLLTTGRTGQECLHVINVFSSVQSLSHVWLWDPMDCSMQGFPIHHRLPGLAQIHVPSSQWCHPTISFSVIPFSFHLQSFPASGSFQMSQFFTSGGQSIGVSASASVLPMNIQDWFPLGWTGWISLQPKGLSRVFSNTTVQNHQFFSA